MVVTSLPPGLPDYHATTPAGIEAFASRLLDAAQARLDEAVAVGGPALLDGLSEAAGLIWQLNGEGSFLALVHPDGSIRDAATTASERVEAWRAALFQRSDLLAALERIDPADLDALARAVRDRHIGALRLAGAHLDEATRAELAACQARMSELQGSFMGNQNADRATIAVERSRLAGLPADALATLQPGEIEGTVVVPISMRPLVLENVRDRGVREAMQRRWFAVARETNREVFREMFDIRRRMAELLGAPSWAAIRAAGGSVRSLERVERFLSEIEGPFRAAVKAQLEGIRQRVAADEGTDPEAFALQEWDVPRGVALGRERLGLDAASIRPYLPLDAVLDGLRSVVETTFGVRVTERHGSFGWHEDVRRFDLADVATGRAIGTVLFDPFAREGKMPGPAGLCDVIAMGVPGEGPASRLTHTAIVLYLTPVADGEVLLTPADVDALFHELGHALDFMLGSSRFIPIDGSSWIGDWSEAPSQSIGRWAQLPAVLAALSRHVETGERLPLDRARAFASASRAGAAVENLRFLWFAKLDLVLHGPDQVDLDAAWQAAWPERGTAPSIELFSPSPVFPIAVGYEGAVYGFLWAQAFMDEIIGRFEREGELSPLVGGAYRRELLEPGWAPDPLERMRKFLGREPSTGPFLERIAG